MFQLYDIHGRIDSIAEETAVTVGVFDGVHRGHQALLELLKLLGHTPSPNMGHTPSPLRGTPPNLGGELLPPPGRGGERLTQGGEAALVVTLTSHPSFVLGRRESEYWLDDPDEHLRLLFEAGAKYVAVLPFTKEVAQLSACEMARLLYENLNMRSLLLGYDSRFGNKSNDDFNRLPQLATEMGFTLQRGNPFLVDNQPISSSRIRESLTSGAVEETAALLGRPYAITGKVLHGRGVGHTLGFPTANIDLSQTRKMLPKEGVYAVKVKNEELGIRNGGMANLGVIPTFDINKPSLEVHLLDFEGDLYGETVTVEFLHRLRDIVRFDSSEALQHQLQQDLSECQLICRQDAGGPKL